MPTGQPILYADAVEELMADEDVIIDETVWAMHRTHGADVEELRHQLIEPSRRWADNLNPGPQHRAYAELGAFRHETNARTEENPTRLEEVPA